MRLTASRLLLLPQLACVALAASSWSFKDATVNVQTKGAGVGAGDSIKLSPTTPLTSALTLTPGGSLKFALTTTDGSKAKTPHQAFLRLEEVDTGLQESFALAVSETGKAKLSLTSKDLPYQLATSSKPLKASIIIGSFGSSAPLKTEVFDLNIILDPSQPLAVPSPAERYASKPEIHHIYKADPRSPPILLSLVFTFAVLAALPALAIGWLALGANVNHLGKATSADPISHALFLGSIVTMEFVFYMYYTTWNLFQTLPAVAVVGLVAVVSGSRALTEVQQRRLAGQR